MVLLFLVTVAMLDLNLAELMHSKRCSLTMLHMKLEKHSAVVSENKSFHFT